MRGGALVVLALSAALSCAGCAGPTFTIRELGQPAFEPLLGARRFARAPEPTPGGFDVYDPETVEVEDHVAALRFWPLSDAETIAIEIRAKSRTAIPLQDLAAAIYPASRAECAAFSAEGRLPAQAPLLYGDQPEDRDGWKVLTLLFPRDQVPAGTTSLAVPLLLRFRDGWIRVQFYKTAVPEPLRRLEPKEAEALEAAERARQAEPSPQPGQASSGDLR